MNHIAGVVHSIETKMKNRCRERICRRAYPFSVRRIMKEKRKPRSKPPTKAVVIRKYVGTESMESVFMEIAEDEVEEAIKEMVIDKMENK